jgi:hypothetical protein
MERYPESADTSMLPDQALLRRLLCSFPGMNFCLCLVRVPARWPRGQAVMAPGWVNSEREA